MKAHAWRRSPVLDRLLLLVAIDRLKEQVETLPYSPEWVRACADLTAIHEQHHAFADAT